ncbi:unnamed protein product [Psylliodes chrysocephalus]|uniref:Cytochrome P450 n=1 Tax=Psylliodes chrysocephalus TaxID=3402493 RepID=A0A9P0CW24_9CUCU|nr:unnamed protein product [Psylliodes chrysocephala]
MLFILSIVAVIVITISYLISLIIKPAKFPPGPFWYPIVGTVPILKKLSRSLGGQHLALLKLSQIYNTNVLGLKLGKENVIAVFSYEAVKEVLTGEEYEGRPDNFFLKLRCMGTRRGVTITDGELWKIQRHFVSTHLRNLGFGKKPMEHMIRNEVDDLLLILKENENKEIRIGGILAVSVLNVLWALLGGSRLNRNDVRLKRLLEFLDERSKAFDMAGGTLNQFPWVRFIAPEESGFNLIKRLNAKLKELLLETIEQHYSTWQQGSDDDLIYAFISQIKNANGKETTFTEDQLIMICLDIFIAGSQTTSNTLDFAFLMMILYPDVQDKVRMCLENAFERTEPINYSERKKVPYVEAVLCEIQRYCHVTPICGPRRVLKDTVLENYSIPKNTTVLISLYSVHHDKKYWKDPEVFRPERFLDSNGNLMYHDRFIPFGLGKRRCLGDALAKSCIFTFFAEIIRNYKITEYPGANKPTGIPIPGITLTPEKYRAKFTENNKNKCF